MALLIGTSGEDLPALALKRQQQAGRSAFGPLGAYQSHGQGAERTRESAHLPLLIFPITFGHNAHLSVTGNSYSPLGDERKRALIFGQIQCGGYSNQASNHFDDLF